MKQKTKLLSALALLAVVICAVAAILVFQKQAAPYDLTEKTNIAMDTIVGVKLYGAPSGSEAEAAMNVVTGLEGVISRYKEGSDVYRLNKTGKCKSTLLPVVLTQCKAIEEGSGGKFDLSVGAVSALWDFDTDTPRLPDAGALQRALSTVDYQKITVTGDTVAASPGQQLDLGSIGKGLACDLVRQYLVSAGVKGAVVSVGGSILAYGQKSDKKEPWSIAIRHPRKENAFLGYIRLDEGFVSTSGDYERYFEQDGKRYCHLLDAKTGYPADSGLCSVTVVCQNGMLSDALSTACYLMGEDASKPLLEANDAAAVFVKTDGTVSVFGDVDFTADES